jgi:hypothetical protein
MNQGDYLSSHLSVKDRGTYFSSKGIITICQDWFLFCFSADVLQLLGGRDARCGGSDSKFKRTVNHIKKNPTLEEPQGTCC